MQWLPLMGSFFFLTTAVAFCNSHHTNILAKYLH